MWSRVTAQPAAAMAQHLLPHLLLSTTRLEWGPTSHSLVIEVICAEVVKELFHDLVVVHDLHNPILHV